MRQELITIAHIRTGFKEKFGIPRQSGLVSDTVGQIIFEPEYRNPDALKGIEEYSHLWLIWGFSKVKQDRFQATVTPPRLGGKIRKGVFATRSPFRPNKMGLSSVELKEVIMDEKNGPILVVAGADLLDDTPIYDIKPYLPYTDSHPNARGSFGQAHREDCIKVAFEGSVFTGISESTKAAIIGILSQDPRAAYNKAPDYVYGMAYEHYDIRFVVENDELKIIEIVDRQKDGLTKVK